MEYKVVLLPIASRDINESAKWYEKKQKGLGKRFTAQIRLKIKFLRENPDAAPIRYDNFRTAVPEVFPFLIHYINDNEKRILIILAVLHTSRDPDMWSVRNKKK